MEPQDDPEARIRELERSLTDQARTSELGVAQPGAYAYPSTPPPVTYSTPFPATSAGRRTGFPWWIVFAVLAVGAVILAVGVAVFASLFSGGGPSNRPGMYGGDGSFTDTPGNRPRTSVGETSTLPPGGNLSVAGVGKNETIACNDGVVTVSGMSNTVLLTGHCASVTVSGVENVVTVDSADTITASGFDNRVTFHSGSPIVQNSGDSNVVEQG